jgi:FixJ family two-component response regulator
MDRGNAGIVAVIDDDDDVGDVLRSLLEVMGYSVETYHSGQAFLDQPTFGRVACVVVDQNMPGMTGIEMLRELAARGVAIPTLLITGDYNSRIVQQATELGVMKVLEKPMSHHELLRFIQFSVG